MVVSIDIGGPVTRLALSLRYSVVGLSTSLLPTNCPPRLRAPFPAPPAAAVGVLMVLMVLMVLRTREAPEIVTLVFRTPQFAGLGSGLTRFELLRGVLPRLSTTTRYLKNRSSASLFGSNLRRHDIDIDKDATNLRLSRAKIALPCSLCSYLKKACLRW